MPILGQHNSNNWSYIGRWPIANLCFTNIIPLSWANVTITNGKKLSQCSLTRECQRKYHQWETDGNSVHYELHIKKTFSDNKVNLSLKFISVGNILLKYTPTHLLIHPPHPPTHTHTHPNPTYNIHVFSSYMISILSISKNDRFLEIIITIPNTVLNLTWTTTFY